MPYAKDEFHVQPFTNVFFFLGRLDSPAPMSEDDKIQGEVLLGVCIEDMERLGLRVSVSQAKEVIQLLQGTHPSTNMHDYVTVLRSAIHIELDQAMFYPVGYAEATNYREPLDGITEEVENSFSSTLEDFREASKCYALGRHTASVFHSMRVAEIGLIALGTELKVPAASNKNWHVLLIDIEKAIKTIGPNGNPNWQDDRQYYSAAAAQFHYFKDAWRNDVMHVHQSYGAERAREILSAVRAFMCQIAMRLHD